MPIRNILVPCDFSENARAALERAIEIAKWTSAKIHLLHACPVELLMAGPEYPYLLPAHVLGKVMDAARTDLEALKKRVSQAGLACELRIAPLSAALAILEAADSIPADLIVMGERTISRLRHRIFGGIVGRVARRALCRVITVRASEANCGRTRSGFDTALPIKGWMSDGPARIAPDATAAAALALMSEQGLRHLPVVDHRLRPIGLISVEELLATAAADARATPALAAPQRTVGELMSHAPCSVRDNATLKEAAELMIRWGLGCLLVLDENGSLCGLLSQGDLLQAFAAAVGFSGQVWLRQRRSPREQLVEEFHRERAVLNYHWVMQHNSDEPRMTGQRDPLAALRVEAIEVALQRAAEGRLGVCASCAAPIPAPRLHALPATEHCPACTHTPEP